MTISNEENTPLSDDALSDIARERRERAEREASRERPQIIESVRQSEVMYYLNLQAMPWRQFDVIALTKRLDEMYSITLSENTDYSPLLKSHTTAQLHQMESDDLLRLLARNSAAKLRWSDGRFPTRGDFVVIRTILVNFESVLVAVAGQSSVAEVVAQEVLEAIWAAAGVKKNWKTDLEKMVELTGYGTSTFLNLSQPFERTLDSRVLDYLNQNIAQGKSFANYMGRFPQSGKSPMYASVSLDDLKFRIATFDSVTGRSDEHEVGFTVVSKNDYGKGRIVATTDMPYDAHVELMLGLFGSVGASA